MEKKEQSKNMDFRYMFGYQMPRTRMSEAHKYASKCTDCSHKSQQNKSNTSSNRLNGSDTSSDHKRSGDLKQ